MLLRRAIALAALLTLMAGCGGATADAGGDAAAPSTHPSDAAAAGHVDAGRADASAEPDASAGRLDAAVPADAAASPDAGIAPDASSADAGLQIDVFGIQMMFPTVAGGREWVLPATADQADSEWDPSNGVTALGGGVFHIENNEVRSSVVSPQGKAWWRDVEMTGYVRRTGSLPGTGQAEHWEWFARGERHSTTDVAPSAINFGAAAPPGTLTWPGYPFAGLASVTAECLGSSYHGNIYADGRTDTVLVEKEISHIEGYATERRGRGAVAGFDPNVWFGFKVVIRSFDAGARVRVETFVDAPARTGWRAMPAAVDEGGWSARTANLNGCFGAPFGYAQDQIITWAGPWATFRSDSMSYDFKWYSVREIAALP